MIWIPYYLIRLSSLFYFCIVQSFFLENKRVLFDKDFEIWIWMNFILMSSFFGSKTSNYILLWWWPSLTFLCIPFSNTLTQNFNNSIGSVRFQPFCSHRLGKSTEFSLGSVREWGSLSLKKVYWVQNS